MVQFSSPPLLERAYKSNTRFNALLLPIHLTLWLCLAQDPVNALLTHLAIGLGTLGGAGLSSPNVSGSEVRLVLNFGLGNE